MKYLKKKHLVIKHSKSNKINVNKQGIFSIFFKNFGLLKFHQFKAINFFLKKRLKFIGKLFFRVTNSIKNTKKPIGVRMGKGKGALDDFYFSVYPGKILVEFFFNNFFILKTSQDIDFFSQIRQIVYLLNKKLNVKVGLLQNSPVKIKKK
jgi:ribosomal protein L16/L10AE